MTLGIMQPYLFPYIGYFQYIAAVDKFVLYNDVSFIRQGWINRNNILLNGKAFMFSVPLQNSSSFRLINDTAIDTKLYDQWCGKFFKTLSQAYSKAPYFDQAFTLVEGVLKMDVASIGDLAAHSVKAVCEAVGIKTTVYASAGLYGNESLNGQDRVIDICLKESVSRYINPKGGILLYSKEDFRQHGIELRFLSSTPFSYPQFANEFVPWLSIIDVMMFNDPSTIQTYLKEYQLD